LKKACNQLGMNFLPFGSEVGMKALNGIRRDITNWNLLAHLVWPFAGRKKKSPHPKSTPRDVAFGRTVVWRLHQDLTKCFWYYDAAVKLIKPLMLKITGVKCKKPPAVQTAF
jgi:hypothetical protein